MDAALAHPLISRFVRSAGKARTLRFDRFMELVLYDPEHGYYSKSEARAGRDGADFLTAPETSWLFGACIAEWIDRVWRTVGGAEFHVVEVGAGRGTLAASMLQAMHPDLRGRVRVHLVERGSAPRRVLEERFRGQARVYEDVRALPAKLGNGVFVANELFDNLPVRRIMKADGWKEIHVRHERGGFRESLTRAPGELVEAAERQGLRLAEGQSAEVSFGAVPLLRSVLGRLDRGGLLVIDYGGEAWDVSGEAAPQGTMAAHRRHGATTDLYAHPGDQDLTAHVNFTPLRAAAERMGYAPARLVPQARFLLDHRLAEILTSRLQAERDELEKLRLTQYAKFLYHPEAMGEAFRVLYAIRAQ